MKLSVVYPAYNESKRIIPTLLEVREYLEKQDYDYEVIIVNDGSTDNMAEIIKKQFPNWPNLKIINNKVNQGKGAAVKQGMLAASGSWRLFMDTDNSTSIKELDDFWKYTKGYHVLIASRYCKNAKILSPQPLSRRILSRLGNMLIQVFVAWGIKDTQCGFKMFSKRAAETIFPKQTLMRWSFDIELIAIAKKYKLLIKEIPVSWKEEKGSKLDISKTSIRTLRDLFKVKWNLIKKRYN